LFSRTNRHGLAGDVKRGSQMARLFRIAPISLGGIALLFAVASAQSGAPQAEAGAQDGPRSTPRLVLQGPIPRTADNKPDLRGAWNAPPLYNSHILEAHRGGFGIQPGKSVVVDPPDGIIPYQPWALAQRNEHRRSENAYLDNEGRCIVSGMPRIMLFTFEMQYAANDIVLFFGYGHVTRFIHMDRRTHLPDGIRLWMGDSIGWWEGDTLVVDTTNFNGKAWFVLGGDFATDALHVVERFTMSDINTLQWKATLTDPMAYTRPWTWQWNAPYKRGQVKEIEADDCQEGNDVLAHLKNNYDVAKAKAASGAAPVAASKAAELARTAQGPFSGVWHYNLDKSGRGRGDTSFPSELVIGQGAGEVHIDAISERQDPIALVYKLDGSATTIAGLGGVSTTTRGTMQGDRLVADSERTFSTPAGDMVVSIKDTYSRTGDALVVNRVQTIAGEQVTATAYYDRTR
jgi:hypothetical protein